LFEIGDEFVPEFNELDEQVCTEILAHSRLPQQFGPQLGRPRVDTLKDSLHTKMKKLRFDAADGVRLIAEEMTLLELCRPRKLSQVRVAKELGIGQEGVSKIEKPADPHDLYASNDRGGYGRQPCPVAQFSDCEPVILSGIAEDHSKNKPTGRKRAYAGAF
jgi:Phage derived protein Gp49-like (DUF891)